jgi:hypothetical protein
MCNVFASCHVVVRATDKSLKKRKAEIGLRIFLKPDLSPPVLWNPPVLSYAGAWRGGIEERPSPGLVGILLSGGILFYPMGICFLTHGNFINRWEF